MYTNCGRLYAAGCSPDEDSRICNQGNRRQGRDVAAHCRGSEKISCQQRTYHSFSNPPISTSVKTCVVDCRGIAPGLRVTHHQNILYFSGDIPKCGNFTSDCGYVQARWDSADLLSEIDGRNPGRQTVDAGGHAPYPDFEPNVCGTQEFVRTRSIMTDVCNSSQGCEKTVTNSSSDVTGLAQLAAVRADQPLGILLSSPGDDIVSSTPGVKSAGAVTHPVSLLVAASSSLGAIAMDYDTDDEAFMYEDVLGDIGTDILEFHHEGDQMSGSETIFHGADGRSRSPPAEDSLKAQVPAMHITTGRSRSTVVRRTADSPHCDSDDHEGDSGFGDRAWPCVGDGSVMSGDTPGPPLANSTTFDLFDQEHSPTFDYHTNASDSHVIESGIGPAVACSSPQDEHGENLTGKPTEKATDHPVIADIKEADDRANEADGNTNTGNREVEPCAESPGSDCTNAKPDASGLEDTAAADSRGVESGEGCSKNVLAEKCDDEACTGGVKVMYCSSSIEKAVQLGIINSNEDTGVEVGFASLDSPTMNIDVSVDDRAKVQRAGDAASSHGQRVESCRYDPKTPPATAIEHLKESEQLDHNGEINGCNVKGKVLTDTAGLGIRAVSIYESIAVETDDQCPSPNPPQTEPTALSRTSAEGSEQTTGTNYLGADQGYNDVEVPIHQEDGIVFMGGDSSRGHRETSDTEGPTSGEVKTPLAGEVDTADSDDASHQDCPFITVDTWSDDGGSSVELSSLENSPSQSTKSCTMPRSDSSLLVTVDIVASDDLLKQDSPQDLNDMSADDVSLSSEGEMTRDQTDAGPSENYTDSERCKDSDKDHEDVYNSSRYSSEGEDNNNSRYSSEDENSNSRYFSDKGSVSDNEIKCKTRDSSPACTSLQPWMSPIDDIEVPDVCLHTGFAENKTDSYSDDASLRSGTDKPDNSVNAHAESWEDESPSNDRQDQNKAHRSLESGKTNAGDSDLGCGGALALCTARKTSDQDDAWRSSQSVPDSDDPWTAKEQRTRLADLLEDSEEENSDCGGVWKRASRKRKNSHQITWHRPWPVVTAPTPDIQAEGKAQPMQPKPQDLPTDVGSSFSLPHTWTLVKQEFEQFQCARGLRVDGLETADLSNPWLMQSLSVCHKFFCSFSPTFSQRSQTDALLGSLVIQFDKYSDTEKAKTTLESLHKGVQVTYVKNVPSDMSEDRLLIVSNLPDNVSQHLDAVHSSVSGVLNIAIPMDQNHMMKGYMLLLCSSRWAAEAFESRKEPLELADKRLRIQSYVHTLGRKAPVKAPVIDVDQTVEDPPRRTVLRSTTLGGEQECLVQNQPKRRNNNNGPTCSDQEAVVTRASAPLSQAAAYEPNSSHGSENRNEHVDPLAKSTQRRLESNEPDKNTETTITTATEATTTIEEPSDRTVHVVQTDLDKSNVEAITVSVHCTPEANQTAVGKRRVFTSRREVVKTPPCEERTGRHKSPEGVTGRQQRLRSTRWRDRDDDEFDGKPGHPERNPITGLLTQRQRVKYLGVLRSFVQSTPRGHKLPEQDLQQLGQLRDLILADDRSRVDLGLGIPAKRPQAEEHTRSHDDILPGHPIDWGPEQREEPPQQNWDMGSVVRKESSEQFAISCSGSKSIAGFPASVLFHDQHCVLSTQSRVLQGPNMSIQVQPRVYTNVGTSVQRRPVASDLVYRESVLPLPIHDEFVAHPEMLVTAPSVLDPGLRFYQQVEQHMVLMAPFPRILPQEYVVTPMLPQVPSELVHGGNVLAIPITVEPLAPSEIWVPIAPYVVDSTSMFCQQTAQQIENRGVCMTQFPGTLPQESMVRASLRRHLAREPFGGLHHMMDALGIKPPNESQRHTSPLNETTSQPVSPAVICRARAPEMWTPQVVVDWGQARPPVLAQEMRCEQRWPPLTPAAVDAFQGANQDSHDVRVLREILQKCGVEVGTQNTNTNTTYMSVPHSQPDMSQRRYSQRPPSPVVSGARFAPTGVTDTATVAERNIPHHGHAGHLGVQVPRQDTRFAPRSVTPYLTYGQGHMIPEGQVSEAYEPQLGRRVEPTQMASPKMATHQRQFIHKEMNASPRQPLDHQEMMPPHQHHLPRRVVPAHQRQLVPGEASAADPQNLVRERGNIHVVRPMRPALRPRHPGFAPEPRPRLKRTAPPSEVCSSVKWPRVWDSGHTQPPRMRRW